MGNPIGDIFNGLRTLGSVTTKVGILVKEAVTNPSIVADALSKADTYSERAGQSLKEKAPVTAEALQAILGLEVKSITTNPTAVKEVINGGGNLAGPTANRAKIIANSAEFKIQQQTIQAEAERLAEQVKLLAELGGSTNTEVRLTNIKDNPIDKAVTKVETGLLTKTEPTGLKEKLTTTGVKTAVETTSVKQAPATVLAEFFKEEITNLNYGKAKAIVNGFISDTRQLPAGAFKNEALEILEKNEIQKDRLMGNNATPQKIESLGNSLSDVLVRYEDSLQGKSPTSVKPSTKNQEQLRQELLQDIEKAGGVEIPSPNPQATLASLREGLQGDDPSKRLAVAEQLISIVEKILKQNPSFAQNYKESSPGYAQGLGSDVELLLESAKQAINNNDSGAIFNFSTNLLEVAQQAKTQAVQRELEVVQARLQNTISVNFDKELIESLNRQIINLKKQLEQ
jgi:hypothetical protein